MCWNTSDDRAYWASMLRPDLFELAYIECCGYINDDGSYTHYNLNDASDMSNWERAFSQGKTPIMQNWVSNWETLSLAGVKKYFAALSAWLGPDRTVIWNPACEFNGSPNGGVRSADGKGWYIDPATYLAGMRIFRQALSESGITNILLGAHLANIGWPADSYVEGLRLADVVGSSLYLDNPPSALPDLWKEAKRIYDLIGTGKPWIFFEYGNRYPTGNMYSPATPEWINTSYALLDTYPFVKGIVWYTTATSEVSGTKAAFDTNAAKYQGKVTPPPEVPASCTATRRSDGAIIWSCTDGKQGELGGCTPETPESTYDASTGVLSVKVVGCPEGETQIQHYWTNTVNVVMGIASGWIRGDLITKPTQAGSAIPFLLVLGGLTVGGLVVSLTSGKKRTRRHRK
jgi:hypothetical protein